MNKPKAQGTGWESKLVGILNGLEGVFAQRLAEGGSTDEGDIEMIDPLGQRWVIEARARERQNVTRALAKARAKAGDEAKHTVLAWKRLVKGEGWVKGQRRVPDGEPVVVVMTLDTYLALIEARLDD